MQPTIRSAYGSLAHVLPEGIGRLMLVVPAGSSLMEAFQNQYPVGDEDGVVRVYTSLSEAISNCRANAGDKIRMAPGSYTISSNIAVSAAGIEIEGTGPRGATQITVSTADTLTVTGDNFRLRNVQFNMAASLSAVVLTGCDNFIIEDCNFFTTVGGAGTYAIEMVTTANSNGIIRRNRFDANLDVSGGTVTVTGFILGLGNRIQIDDNNFNVRRQTTANNGVVTAAILFAAAADWGVTISRNTFVEHNGATFTAGINYGTTVTDGGVIPFDNRFQMGTMANAIVNGTNSAGIGNQAPANGTV